MYFPDVMVRHVTFTPVIELQRRGFEIFDGVQYTCRLLEVLGCLVVVHGVSTTMVIRSYAVNMRLKWLYRKYKIPLQAVLCSCYAVTWALYSDCTGETLHFWTLH